MTWNNSMDVLWCSWSPWPALCARTYGAAINGCEKATYRRGECSKKTKCNSASYLFLHNKLCCNCMLMNAHNDSQGWDLPCPIMGRIQNSHCWGVRQFCFVRGLCGLCIVVLIAKLHENECTLDVFDDICCCLRPADNLHKLWHVWIVGTVFWPVSSAKFSHRL